MCIRDSFLPSMGSLWNRAAATGTAPAPSATSFWFSIRERMEMCIRDSNGAVRYTIGQRKGLGLAMGAPVYVCAKDMQANTVTVGPEENLFDRIVYADEGNWIAIPELTAPLRVTARTRYHQTEQVATVYPAGEGQFRLEFDQPQRAPTPGQAVVLYQGDVVLGGGTIVAVE